MQLIAYLARLFADSSALRPLLLTPYRIVPAGADLNLIEFLPFAIVYCWVAKRAMPSLCQKIVNGWHEVTSTYSLRSNFNPSKR